MENIFDSNIQKHILVAMQQRKKSMERIEKDFSELDWSKVDFQSGYWSWGRGGLPYKDSEYSINYTDDKLVQTRYKLPGCINDMLKNRYNSGTRDTKRAIQNVLGIRGGKNNWDY